MVPTETGFGRFTLTCDAALGVVVAVDTDVIIADFGGAWGHRAYVRWFRVRQDGVAGAVWTAGLCGKLAVLRGFRDGLKQSVRGVFSGCLGGWGG